jgi:glyoxylase-like metal-dependent hydrolase (beta-lactamase superfamily II)
LFAFGPEAGAAGLTKIADNVYSYVDTRQSAPPNSFGANAGIIIGKKGVVVVDTLISAKQARKFIKDIGAVTGKPIKYVINTHGHLDHTFGNYEFAKRGAIIIAQKNCLLNMKKHSESALKNAKNFGLTLKDMKGTKIAYPTLTFTEGMEIDLGDQMVELVNTGYTHTDDSIMVYLPASKVLFTGDVLFTSYHPFLGEGDIPGWTRGLDNIMKMDVNKIIPGHGPLSSKKDVEDMKNYLLAFDAKATELAVSAKSNDAPYIASELLKALPQRPEGAGLVLWNIQKKYLKK